MDATRWSLILAAANGDRGRRDEFTRCYAPVARAWLSARWRAPAARDDVDDAVQEVLLDCVREGGALQRVDAGRDGGFRAFFSGIVRRVALKFEAKRARLERGREGASSLELVADEATLSKLFDREYALAVVRQAHAVHRRDAEAAGPDALRRVELLRLRFEEELPIRTIAARLGLDASEAHRMYARARREFRLALREVVREREAAGDERVDAACDELLGMLA